MISLRELKTHFPFMILERLINHQGAVYAAIGAVMAMLAGWTKPGMKFLLGDRVFASISSSLEWAIGVKFAIYQWLAIFVVLAAAKFALNEVNSLKLNYLCRHLLVAFTSHLILIHFDAVGAVSPFRSIVIVSTLALTIAFPVLIAAMRKQETD